ncbi:MAG: mycothiol conjugate amidase Mca [Nitriliruptorales bacterium]|nr:mycothiol conjugate amidase Mca [Nitriliruptorales bacterium]
MSRRLLFVHAHPDDESSKGAATAARYVDGGAEVALVTCTGGEAGEVLNPSMDDVPPEEMSFIREAELAAAVEIIGFTDTYSLGYRDSGFHEDPSAVPEGTFARTPVDEPAADLAAVITTVRPQVVVTYPEDGGYPHPDHIMVHEVTMRALELAEEGDDPWRVPKVYACTAFPAERVLALHEALQKGGLESPFEGWMERRAERRGGDEPPIGARIRVDEWFDRRDDALLAHATQIDPDGFWFAVPRKLEREVFPYECYVRLRSDVEVTDDPEDDLFQGIDR